MIASCFLISILIGHGMSFSRSASLQKRNAPASTKMFSAMERLHDPSTNAFGPLENVYSLIEIDEITHKIEDDEWAALGSAIAETMLEMILDVGSGALKRMGWVERMSVTNKVAEDVSQTVTKSLYTIRFQPLTFDQGHHRIPDELLSPLYKLLRQELRNISGDESFECTHQNLSLLVISSVGQAIETYLGITNVNAPFFCLNKEMEHRVSNRRKELLVKHSKGYESVKDVEKDIEDTRKNWLRVNLGKKAAVSYHFGKITTKVGHGEVAGKKTAVPSLWNALIQDLDGVLLP
ncbi:hypothetical protein HJC23_010908 [Cyclotella cryptica]|uniref:Uncharacterized protein n=1 Tax=Cyclotella cryptica TaxID=29204 RepID=A0ABD3QB77_9STRA|eukprot:CCRYP_007541-RA/>CCRYP_007541-RA protein AED:0.00 eAED:0.00 QI:395/1/1/1/1/1/2/875/292